MSFCADHFSFSDLQQLDGLTALDGLFLARLEAHLPRRHAELLRRRAGESLPAVAESEFILDCAPLIEELLGEVFGLTKQMAEIRARATAGDPIFVFKKSVVQKRAKKRLLSPDPLPPFKTLDRWLDDALIAHRLESGDRELAVATLATTWLADEAAHDPELAQMTDWCVQAIKTGEGHAAVRDWVSFRLPKPVDAGKLVPIVPVAGDPAGRVQGPAEHFRHRDGFGLTDTRMSPREVANQIHYCIYCHDHDGDFCSKGFPEKKARPELGLKVNVHGDTLTGCPLEEKISEMHALKREGHVIAPLAVVMIDNPMCPATGHRICNDCMKACIYQKQEPVDIPQIETRVLTDVLALSCGVEIYDLLVRWNPLRARQWLPKPYNGLKALVIGMGPAGFTLAHHLLMEGFAVIGVEGLKIEPLPDAIIENPVHDWATLEEPLDRRVMAGFGGVAEYGITVRWDKNFLKLIHLTLARRPLFQMFGGVRFGGTITVEDAWKLGFDHVAICIGAGLPQALPIPGSLAPGMRQANDFLMALQLTGASRATSLANLQLRLPAVVIGGGLTGVDAATEAQAYYIVQVEKTLARYEQLAHALGEPAIRGALTPGDLIILDELLDHGRSVRAERERAAAARQNPDLAGLIRRFGGVTIAYRRGMNDSPAYTRNHEEIIKAFEEGITYAEGLEPVEALRDAHGHIEALVTRRMQRGEDGRFSATDELVQLPARSVLVATGARPNVAYEFEHHGHFHKQSGHYQTHADRGGRLVPLPVASHCKQHDVGPFTSYAVHDRRVSFLGDTHPVFHGSVVKAIASATRTWGQIVAAFGDRARQSGNIAEYAAFRDHMADLFTARVESVERKSANVVEVRVRAPQAARNFKPGQFFRLQNFEAHAQHAGKEPLAMEAVALIGAKVDKDAGAISLMVIENGASSRLAATLKVGEPVTLMGPTGFRTVLPQNETVMIAGGRLGAAYARAVGPALRAAGNRVLYIAGFRAREDVYCQDDLETAADVILWNVEHGPPVCARRPQDRSCQGDYLTNLLRYARGELETGTGRPPPIPLTLVQRLLVVGSSRLVRLMKQARRDVLAPWFVNLGSTQASIHTPMQCMLKGVCSQCLQWQVDPNTGRRTKAVFACSWQDQPIDIVDLDNLDERLSQNRVAEHLTNLWLDHLYAQPGVTRV